MQLWLQYSKAYKKCANIMSFNFASLPEMWSISFQFKLNKFMRYLIKTIDQFLNKTCTSKKISDFQTLKFTINTKENIHRSEMPIYSSQNLTL